MKPTAENPARPRELSVLGMVACIGAVFFGSWLIWCGAFQFAGAATEAEIVRTRTVQRSRKGRRYVETYGVVRYADQAGQVHTDEVQLYGETSVGRKIAVRYLPHRPDDIRRDEFWDIWGLAVLSTGVFAALIGLTWFVERRRLIAASRPDPFDQPGG